MVAVLTLGATVVFGVVQLGWIGGAGGGAGPGRPVVSDESAALEQISKELVVQVARSLKGDGSGRPVVAFLGVEHGEGADLGALAATTEEAIKAELIRSGLVRLIEDDEFIESLAALHEQQAMALPERTGEYLAKVRALGVDPRYLLWGELEEGEGGRSVAVSLVDMTTGELVCSVGSRGL